MIGMSRQMREFLEGVHFAVVATLRSDGLPHQTVMWYELENEDTILLNTPSGSLKHRQLSRDPRLSVCVEDGYRYVTARGTVMIDEDAERAGQDYARLGHRYRSTFRTWRPAGGDDRPAILERDRVTLRLKIESIVSNGF